MNKAEIFDSVGEYQVRFQQFVEGYRLPEEWFSKPDHIAIKCADEIDYFSTCDALKPHMQDGFWEANIDDRMLAAARFTASLGMSDKFFEWVEVMQPKPGKELDAGFVEHAEFTVPDFYEVRRVLSVRGVEGFETQANEGHAWINVPIDDYGREIKFNDKPLSEVVAKEIEEGKIHQVIEDGY